MCQEGSENGGRFRLEWLVSNTCLEDGRALGKKESEEGRSRSKVVVCGRRVSVVKLVLLQGGGKVGGMEVEPEM